MDVPQQPDEIVRILAIADPAERAAAAERYLLTVRAWLIEAQDARDGALAAYLKEHPGQYAEAGALIGRSRALVWGMFNPRTGSWWKRKNR